MRAEHSKRWQGWRIEFPPPAPLLPKSCSTSREDSEKHAPFGRSCWFWKLRKVPKVSIDGVFAGSRVEVGKVSIGVGRRGRSTQAAEQVWLGWRGNFGEVSKFIWLVLNEDREDTFRTHHAYRASRIQLYSREKNRQRAQEYNPERSSIKREPMWWWGLQAPDKTTIQVLSVDWSVISRRQVSHSSVHHSLKVRTRERRTDSAYPAGAAVLAVIGSSAQVDLAHGPTVGPFVAAVTARGGGGGWEVVVVVKLGRGASAGRRLMVIVKQIVIIPEGEAITRKWDRERHSTEE